MSGRILEELWTKNFLQVKICHFWPWGRTSDRYFCKKVSLIGEKIKFSWRLWQVWPMKFCFSGRFQSHFPWKALQRYKIDVYTMMEAIETVLFEWKWISKLKIIVTFFTFLLLQLMFPNASDRNDVSGQKKLKNFGHFRFRYEWVKSGWYLWNRSILSQEKTQ